MGMWAQVSDVVRRYDKPIPTSRHGWISSLIDDAEDQLTLKVADLPARVTAGEVPATRVQRIVAAAVLEVVRNPDGFTQQSQTVGPYSTSVTRPAATAPAGTRFRFADEDLDALRPPPRPGARSVRLALPAWRVP